MVWKRLVGLLVLVVLAGLPVSGAVCAVQCDDAARHHGPAKSCHESVGESAGSRIASVSSHDCSDHDAAVCEPTAAGSAPSAAMVDITAASGTSLAPAAPSGADAYGPGSTPPDPTPPSARPLVLRI